MNKYTQYGFTILESLVAFAIFAISLGVLLQIYSKGTQVAKLGEEYAIATLIAQSKMASITYTNDTNIGTYYGQEGDTYRWTITVSPYDDHAELKSNQHLAKRKVDVEVLWGNGRKTRSIQLSSMKLVSIRDI